MARYRTQVQVGAHTIWVEADDPKELIKEVSYLSLLDMGAEGRTDAEFYYRKAGKYEYFGFRRGDGAELTFGQLTEPPVKHHQLFAYHPKSEGYKGYKRYNHDTGDQEDAE